MSLCLSGLWLTYLLLLALCLAEVSPRLTAGPSPQPRSFTIQGDCFLRDSKCVQLVAGSLHYFRVPPAYWGDRLQRLRAMGLNTIETYVPWNFHEPSEGIYDFEGWRDFETFMHTAQSLGFMVLLRIGPPSLSASQFWPGPGRPTAVPLFGALSEDLHEASAEVDTHKLMRKGCPAVPQPCAPPPPPRASSFGAAGPSTRLHIPEGQRLWTAPCWGATDGGWGLTDGSRTVTVSTLFGQCDGGSLSLPPPPTPSLTDGPEKRVLG